MIKDEIAISCYVDGTGGHNVELKQQIVVKGMENDQSYVGYKNPN